MAGVQIDDSASQDKRKKAYGSLIRLALAAWTVQFKTPDYVKETTMSFLEQKNCKETLRASSREPDVRKSIGSNNQFWDDLCQFLQAANPSLEKRCFATTDPSAPEYEASGALIAINAGTLLKDLERLNDVTAIARNVLTTGEPAQKLAATSHVEERIFKLISTCVRITARGYDGDAGTSDEEKWQMVVNAYKKFLITSLQLLNNFIAQNDRCKEILWVELFDPLDIASEPGAPLGGSTSAYVIDYDFATEHLLKLSRDLIADVPPIDYENTDRPANPYILYERDMRRSIEETLPKGASEHDMRVEGWRRWRSLSEGELKRWELEWISAHYRTLDELSESSDPRSIPKKQDEIAFALYLNRLNLNDKEYTEVEPDKLPSYIVDKYTGRLKMEKSMLSSNAPEGAHGYARLAAWYDPLNPQPATGDDYSVTYTVEEGAKILQEGKDSLMRQIENEPPPTVAPPQPTTVASPASSGASPPASGHGFGPSDSADYEPALSEDEENSDDDYDGLPGEDGRGLLTDVPLILGPSEIDVLPIIIMSSIVAPYPNARSEENKNLLRLNKSHAVRCQRLLAYENGRNLLRELLIFVAAWDLREDELYYKLMIKIMDTILMNGLMPLAYDAFKDSRSKDVISPAQAVVIKLLASIFRTRQAPSTTQPRSNLPAVKNAQTSSQLQYPYHVDVVIVKELFIEFRRRIIPRTCGLIFLQGNIRNGRAHPEEFPINLWDMERMYEGVYQYLEFFAVLTEHDVWKQMMIDWEVIGELVTLLKDLDFAIPKGQLSALRRSSSADLPPPPPPPNQQESSPRQSRASTAKPIAVERPYDTNLAASAANTAVPTSSNNNTTYEPDVPLAYPEDVEEPTDEPSDYEWRNLKKITVLVLTSLVWKSRPAQDQVRKHGGIEAVLNCTQHDEHNPYIREHAIMCLRFLLDSNKENQDVVRALEARGIVPSEVLDKRGYETWMDERGRVGLRRKGGESTTAAAAAAATPAASGSPSASRSQPSAQAPSAEQDKAGKPNVGNPRMPAEQAAERIVKDMPLSGSTGATRQGRYDPEKAAALAKLDKRFEEGK
ncbi:MAG: copper transport protein [Bathelium mastoideum]|nr:MAG: copper transport protein [Bathelium mastoideum]KAI9691014.1 MAG: copper transport protein [Bathelium mastoideum]